MPATALRDDASIQRDLSCMGVTYLHLLFDRHEIIFAEGAPVESLHAPWLTQAPLPPALRAELEALFPTIFDGVDETAPARPFLTVSEGRILALQADQPFGAGGGT